MKIGIVDLDTSHPQNWIPIERELGHEIVGVWDGGSVHPPDYVEKFAAERGLRVFPSLAEMVPEVDGVILHGCDWDAHIAKARPFVEAGKSVLIDKPLAGNGADLQQIRVWAREGARITGGSSLWCSQEAQQWLARPEAERGHPHMVLCGCAVDDFNYGIHAYTLLCRLMGAGAVSVRHLGEGVQRHLQINWPDHRLGLAIVGHAAAYLPFYATVVTEKAVTHFTVDSSGLYRALLEATLPYLAGETDTPPLPIDTLLEPEQIALAARNSWLHGDREITLAEVATDPDGYDGALFAEGYRKSRYA